MTYTYKVGGHIFSVDDECSAFDENLYHSCAPFSVDASSESVKIFAISIVSGDKFKSFPSDFIGNFDGGSVTFSVYSLQSGGYSFTICEPSGEECCKLVTTSDFSSSEVFLTGNCDLWTLGIKNCMMVVYAFASAGYDTLLMHSSVVMNSGKGYLFLGKSGTGKSTHTRLWLNNIEGSELMNDDNPVVRVIDGTVMVYGSPWSGKTPCYRNVEAPAGAFVMLEQKPFNRISRMKVLESFAAMISSCSSIKWDKRIYDAICSTIGRILETVPLYKLECLPDREAAELSSKTIMR